MSTYTVKYRYSKPGMGGTVGEERVKCETEATAMQIVKEKIQIKFPQHDVAIVGVSKKD
jgi:hypothetical protein